MSRDPTIEPCPMCGNIGVYDTSVSGLAFLPVKCSVCSVRADNITDWNARDDTLYQCWYDSGYHEGYDDGYDAAID